MFIIERNVGYNEISTTIERELENVQWLVYHCKSAIWYRSATWRVMFEKIIGLLSYRHCWYCGKGWFSDVDSWKTVHLSAKGGDWKCGSGKCDTSKNARVESAGVENAGVDSRGGKCRSRLAVWKAEPRLYRETALSYFLKIVLRLMTE